MLFESMKNDMFNDFYDSLHIDEKINFSNAVYAVTYPDFFTFVFLFLIFLMQQKS